MVLIGHVVNPKPCDILKGTLISAVPTTKGPTNVSWLTSTSANGPTMSPSVLWYVIPQKNRDRNKLLVKDILLAIGMGSTLVYLQRSLCLDQGGRLLWKVIKPIP